MFLTYFNGLREQDLNNNNLNENNKIFLEIESYVKKINKNAVNKNLSLLSKEVNKYIRLYKTIDDIQVDDRHYRFLDLDFIGYNFGAGAELEVIPFDTKKGYYVYNIITNLSFSYPDTYDPAIRVSTPIKVDGFKAYSGPFRDNLDGEYYSDWNYKLNSLTEIPKFLSKLAIAAKKYSKNYN